MSDEISDNGCKTMIKLLRDTADIIERDGKTLTTLFYECIKGFEKDESDGVTIFIPTGEVVHTFKIGYRDCEEIK